MITFTNTVSINRPAADIYAYLSNLENTPEWNWAITETTKTTSGPITVGTRYRQIRTVPQAATETLEITALDPNRHIEIQGTLAALPARLSYDLIKDQGGTMVANTVNPPQATSQTSRRGSKTAAPDRHGCPHEPRTRASHSHTCHPAGCRRTPR